MNPSNDIYTLLQNSILSHEPLIEPYLHTPPNGALVDRIAIYTNGFYSRLEEVLLSDYQTLALLMGIDAFSQLCKQYVASYPSSNYSLNYLGQYLSKFLTETPPYDQKPYLAEIASYEWAESVAFTAADARLLTTAELQSLPPDQWPDLRFSLHPSCHLLHMHWNSFALINTLRDDYNPPPKAKKLVHPQAIMVWRRQLQIRYYLLDSSELIMLEAMKNNASFIEICEHLNLKIQNEDIASYLVSKLNIWLQEQLFVQAL